MTFKSVICVGLIALTLAGCADRATYVNRPEAMDATENLDPAIVQSDVATPEWVWNNFGPDLREMVCNDIAVLAPSAAIALIIQGSGGTLSQQNAQAAYEYFAARC